jgi:hypothetical protein
MVTIDDQGMISRIPYRVYLMAGVCVSIVFAAAILWLILRGESAGHTATLPPILFLVLMALLIGTLAALYTRKQRQSLLAPGGMAASDVFLYGPDMDERDLAIKRKARWCGFGAFWFVFVFGLLGVWGWNSYQGQQTMAIDIGLLPILVFGAFILVLIVDSIVTVILYREGAIDGEN